MQLDDLIQYLALSELGSSKFFEQKPKNPNALYEITARNRAMLINHINEATMEVCKKIPLYWNTVVLRLVEGKNSYFLNSKHSIRNIPDGVDIPDEPLILGSEEADYYIYDSVDNPFEDNLLMIGKVSSLSGEYDMNIGNSSYQNAIYTPRPNIIELPEDMYENDEYVTLHYLSHTVPIPLSEEAGSEYEVEFPVTLLEAISAFICHKIQLKPQDANNASIAISHMDRFNTICDNYVNANISNTSNDVTMSTFSKGGWV